MSDDGWDEDDDGYGGTTQTATPQSYGSVGRGQSFNQMNGSTSRGRGFGFGRGRGMASRSEQDRSWRSGGDEPRVGGSKLSSDGSSLRLDVANRSLGRIIGRGGSKIRELQDSSGARINILKEEAGAEYTPVELCGSQDCQQQAKQLIDDLLQDSFGGGGRRDDGGGGFGGRRDDGGGGGGLSEHIQFPNTEIRRLIGRGGSRIQAIQDGSSCRVKILNDEAGSFETPILLQGSKSAIETAKQLIKEVEEEHLEETKPKPVETVAPVKTSGINWADLRAMREESERARFAGLPEIVKNFYIEHPEVANRHPQEVEEIRKKNMNISVENLHKEGLGSIPNPCLTFDECFEHYPEILSELKRSGFTTPTPIQMQGWPVALQGLDLIGIAQTGTGKTLAFLLPAFIHIEGQPVPRSKREGPTVLVLSPTRELALQIETETKKYSYKGIQCCCVYGGGNRREQIAIVRQGVEIIVATPGRLNDLILNEVISLKAVTYLVLDEADRMLDMGFEPEIRKVLLDIRPDRQTIMTSATWPPDVRRLAESYMTNPIQVFVGSLDLAAVHSVTQLIEFLEPEEKKERLLYFLTEELGPKDKVIVFLGKKVMVDDIASDFHLAGIDCQSIHGGREQIDREQAIEDLKTGSVQILIATDVASRGLDIKDVTHVINYDFPHNMEEYVHRVGRTGRAGQKGTALTFMTRKDWRNAKGLIDILVEAEQEVPRELEDMARRFQSRLDRDRSEGGGFRSGGGGFRGGGGGGRGGGGFRRGGGRDRNDFGGFGGDDFSSDFFGDLGGGGGGRRGRGGRRGKDSFIRNAFGVP